MRHNLNVCVWFQRQQRRDCRRRNNRSQKVLCHRRVLEAYTNHVRTIKHCRRAIPEGVPVNMAGWSLVTKERKGKICLPVTTAADRSAITTKIEKCVCVFVLHHSLAGSTGHVYAVQEMGEGIVYIHLCRHHRGDRVGVAG